MAEELQVASKLLGTALDQYIAACSAIRNRYDFHSTLKSIAQEISDTLLNELEVVSSYKAKMKQAKVIINKTRNVIPATTPIHMLPPSVLSYIFQLVRDASSDDSYRYRGRDSGASTPAYSSPNKYPETFSYVCSHWRRIAIESRALWSHIKVGERWSRYRYYHDERLFPRARVFAARSDPSPVDIHIISDSFSYYANSDLNEFVASVAPRIRSFDMSPTSTITSFSEMHKSVFESWLGNCKPGALKELVLKGNVGNNSYETIEASEAPIHSNSQLLEMPYAYLEDRLSSIRVLRLTGLYFPWESRAYHGLVELRLTPIRDGMNFPISQSQLRAILTASPRLRELHFGLEVTETLSHDDPHIAVSLPDLEVVNLCSTKWGGQSAHNAILPLLAPSAKPLQLSLSRPYTSTRSFLGDGTTEFIARSNVTKLHIESIDINNTGKFQPVVLLEIFRLLDVPNLRALSLSRFYLRPSQPCPLQGDKTAFQANGAEPKSDPSPQLDTVHLRDCTVDLDCLQRVVQTISVQKVNYKGCWFYNMEDGYSSQLDAPQPQDNIPPIFNHVTSLWPLDESDPWAQPVP